MSPLRVILAFSLFAALAACGADGAPTAPTDDSGLTINGQVKAGVAGSV